jgi:hypothetical protein
MCDFEQKQIYTEKSETQKPVATVHYRGYDINVYNDDYGQCYYFYFDDRCISCGTYNLDYESCVHWEVDQKLDHIETIYNEKPYHPSAEIRWMFDQETGERKKVVKYDGFIKPLDCQDGDYHNEVKSIMDKIDAEYDEAHENCAPRIYLSDLIKELETEE